MVVARSRCHQSLDVLFIDEAAQMSLANVLAVSQAANSIVLLGDPRQLEQPMQGSHPEGTDVQRSITFSESTPPFGRSADCSWKKRGACIRIICTFTSELFYDSRFARAAGPSAAINKVHQPD